MDLFDYFDGDKSGTISYDEFLRGVRGVLNARRHGLVEQAYAVLDADGSGTVDILDIMKVYDASKHPDVVSGLRTKAEVFREATPRWNSCRHPHQQATPCRT